MKTMTVGELRRALEKFSDDDRVVVANKYNDAMEIKCVEPFCDLVQLVVTGEWIETF